MEHGQVICRWPYCRRFGFTAVQSLKVFGWRPVDRLQCIKVDEQRIQGNAQCMQGMYRKFKRRTVSMKRKREVNV